MNQAQLIEAISASTGINKAQIGHVLNGLAAAAHSELLAGGELTLPGIGKLKVQNKPAKTARNPKTGEEVQVPAKRVPKFVAAKALKDAIQ